MNTSPYGNINNAFQNETQSPVNGISNALNTNQNKLNCQTKEKRPALEMDGSYHKSFDQYNPITSSQGIIFPRNYLTVDHLRHNNSSPFNNNNNTTYYHTAMGNYTQDGNTRDYLPLLSTNAIELGQGEQFPTSFNPRKSPNMPHKEKVNSWIKEVPVHLLRRERDGIEIWQSDCYPAVIPITSCSSTFNDSLHDHRDNETVSRDFYIDDEDVLEFQSRKITEYVRRLYNMDRSDVAMKGGSSMCDNNYDNSSEEPYVEAFQDADDDRGTHLKGDLNLEFFETDQFQADLACAVGKVSKRRL